MIDQIALRFFRSLHENPELLSDGEVLNQGMTRDVVGKLFRMFHKSEPKERKQNLPKNNLEGRIMASLRVQKLMKSKRYDATVICVFANSDGKTFAPIEERQNARQKFQQQREELRSNKAGIEVSEEPDLYPGNGPRMPMSAIMPVNEDIPLQFQIHYGDAGPYGLELLEIKVSGTQKRSISVGTETPMSLYIDEFDDTNSGYLAKFSFRTNRIAAHRVTIVFHFRKRRDIDGLPNRYESIRILRDVLLRSGDPELYNVLQPKTPYMKKKKHDKEKRVDPKDIVPPPKNSSGRRSGGYKDLGHFRIPKNTSRQVHTGEMEDALVVPWNWDCEADSVTVEDFVEGQMEFGNAYARFWQNLLWASELQAYDDIRLFDMENVALEAKGRLLQMYVSGLAEGRPSVLKGDLVLCKWKSKEYRGRVEYVGMISVLLEFHGSFHKNFDVNVDRVERVRFTFQRTTFRTAHAGILAAQTSMGETMLLPSKDIVQTIIRHRLSTGRARPIVWKWTSSLLNVEQKCAVEEIVKGRLRPLPYVIFGPPGTGKTTTLVEAIYQLVNLRKFDLKILVVAPSNDATDILVEKLSQYFPPSEMVRVLAYTRSIEQVPENVRKYCTAGLEAEEVISKIMSVKITVATINMASRLWCTGDGVPKGYFDVLCVDEAGHATEPEVIAVASTLMEFRDQKGQIVLAGDPKQLGPIVTSELCKTFKMDRSYLERLVETSPAYNLENNSDVYPPELVTLLVNNYRSHHQILKLPNEMFYRNQLIANGDIFQTHSMTTWEHLPTKGFPIVFHAVDGENTREGNSPSWFNPQEAMVVVEYVKKLVEESKPKISPEDIGIITPYARQVQKIRLALKKSDIEDVKVGSVETFQGQERRVIIISTVRSENSLLQHDLRFNLGFVANEKRFNVAVTRAKALLIVVGNPRVLETDTKNWLPLLRFCKNNNSWLGEDWDEGASISSSESDDDEQGMDDKVDKDEWAVAAQEAYCFINREE